MRGSRLISAAPATPSPTSYPLRYLWRRGETIASLRECHRREHRLLLWGVASIARASTSSPADTTARPYLTAPSPRLHRALSPPRTRRAPASASPSACKRAASVREAPEQLAQSDEAAIRFVPLQHSGTISRAHSPRFKPTTPHRQPGKGTERALTTVASPTPRRFGRLHRSLSSPERSGTTDSHHGRLHEQREQ